MSYKFKVGDEGLMRGGEYAYKVVAVDVPDVYEGGRLALVAMYRSIKAASPCSSPCTRLMDGSHPSITENARGLDLIPPKRKVWRVIYKRNPVRSGVLAWTQDYDNEAGAKAAVKSLTNHFLKDTVTLQEIEVDYE